jgi:hypothetical protein
MVIRKLSYILFQNSNGMTRCPFRVIVYQVASNCWGRQPGLSALVLPVVKAASLLAVRCRGLIATGRQLFLCVTNAQGYIKTGSIEGVEALLCTFFNISASWDGWSTARSGRLTPGKETRYPLCRRLGGTPGPVWTDAENVAPHRELIPGPFSP